MPSDSSLALSLLLHKIIKDLIFFFFFAVITNTHLISLGSRKGVVECRLWTETKQDSFDISVVEKRRGRVSAVNGEKSGIHLIYLWGRKEEWSGISIGQKECEMHLIFLWSRKSVVRRQL